MIKGMETQPIQSKDLRFESVYAYLPAELRQIMMKLPMAITGQVHEIRLRADRPVVLFTGRENLFLQLDGGTDKRLTNKVYRLSKRELQDCFKLVCEYSVHSFQEEIRQGFITIKGGHRVGITGTCIFPGREISGMRDISSLNIRIARQQEGSADELVHRVFSGGLCSLLIIGEAGSGKTTLLRDAVRQLSNGAATGSPVKVAVVDERGEISASHQGVPQNDVGLHTDVYHLYPKAVGMSMALRTISPQVIACDEIGSEDDASALLETMHAGVYTIATAHGCSVEDVLRRGRIAEFIKRGGFCTAAILKGRETPCEIKAVQQLEYESERTE